MLIGYPAALSTVPMAWEMSPMRAPGRAAAMPAARARSVVAMSATLSAGRASPTRKLIAEGDGQVEGQQVTVGECVVVGESVKYSVINGRADVVTERTAPEGGRVVDVAGLSPSLEDHRFRPAVDVQKVCADRAASFQGVQDVADQCTGLLCSGQFGGVEDLDHALARVFIQ
jgi:hypothetical protein